MTNWSPAELEVSLAASSACSAAQMMHFHPAHNKTVICWYSITITQIHGHNGRHDMGPRGSYNAFYGQGCCKFLMLYQIGNGLVAIPAAAYLEPVPICTRRFETRYVQIQCNTGTYSQTFFPSAIQLWNTLPADICQLSPAMGLLKNYLWHVNHKYVFRLYAIKLADN